MASSIFLNAPTLTTVNGGASYHADGTLFWENPVVSTTAASTTFVTGTAYPLPAATLVTDGDRLLIDVVVSIPTAAAADNKNLVVGIGYTSFSTATGSFTGGITAINVSSASNQGQVNWHVVGEIIRLSATTIGYRWFNEWESGASSTTTVQSAGWTTGAMTWANPNNILAAVGNTTGGNTQVLTLQEWRVLYQPR